jgi:hypothetical protein
MTCYDRGVLEVIVNGTNQSGDVRYLVSGGDKVHYLNGI